MPAPHTTRSPTRSAPASGPAATTRPTNSWPSTTGGWASSGPCAHSDESVPQIAARATSMTTSPPAGSAGSGTDSMRMSRGSSVDGGPHAVWMWTLTLVAVSWAASSAASASTSGNRAVTIAVGSTTPLARKRIVRGHSPADPMIPVMPQRL